MEWDQIKQYLLNNEISNEEIWTLEKNGYVTNTTLPLLNSEQLDEMGITSKARKALILYSVSQLRIAEAPAASQYKVGSSEVTPTNGAIFFRYTTH